MRNSFSILCAHLRRFLVLHLAFDDSLFDNDVVRAFWSAMGIRADLLDSIVALNPRWDGIHVHVAMPCADGAAFDRIVSLFLLVSNWRRFTDTRWAGTVPACRSLVGSLSIGLDGLVAMTRSDKACSDYHLHGSQRLTKPVRYYAVVTMFSPIVTCTICDTRST